MLHLKFLFNTYIRAKVMNEIMINEIIFSRRKKGKKNKSEIAMRTGCLRFQSRNRSIPKHD